jgi:hypothetical protein
MRFNDTEFKMFFINTKRVFLEDIEALEEILANCEEVESGILSVSKNFINDLARDSWLIGNSLCYPYNKSEWTRISENIPDDFDDSFAFMEKTGFLYVNSVISKLRMSGEYSYINTDMAHQLISQIRQFIRLTDLIVKRGCG